MLRYLNDLWNLLMIPVSEGKCPSHYSVNVKGSLAHLTEKIQDKELRSLQYLRYHEDTLIVLSQNIWKTSVLPWAAKLCNVI